MLPCDIEEPWSGMQAGMRKRKAVVTDLEGNWCKEQSWMDTQKGDVQVKERKEARHEGEWGCLFLFYVSPNGLLISLLVESEGASISFLSSLLLILTCYVSSSLPWVRWQLWLARWGSGSSVVVGKLSFGWLVGAATCYAFLDPSHVSERGDMWKQEMSFSWMSPSQCWSFLQNIVDRMACPLSDCMTPVRGLREHTSSRDIQFHCCPSVVDRKFFIETKSIFCHSLLSVLFLSPISHMKLIWSFCILLSWLLEKRSQENLDSMRNLPVIPFIWNDKALIKTSDYRP